MKHPIFITCYKSPELCRRALHGLQSLGHLQRHGAVLIDHSDDDNHAIYQLLAKEFGAKAFQLENGGASQAKRNVVKIANQLGHKIVHQMSEDFIVNDQSYSGVASGVHTFLMDSELILSKMPNLGFVRWNIYTSHNGDMSYFWRGENHGNLFLKFLVGATLPFVVGRVLYTNWPATWRVSHIDEIWTAAEKWEPLNEQEKELAITSGNEWAASHCGVGSGAVLVANPMRHPDRIKPADSIG